MVVLLPLLSAVGFLLAYEFYAIFTGKKLVTTYFREAFAAVPGVFVLIALVLGYVMGHFFWGA